MFDNKAIIQQVKDRVNIVDVIGQRVKLQRKGANYFGICPFHNEKTSSFAVNPNKQIFHCFGCGKSGDVFEFLVDYENISFKEALEMLAGIAGIAIPKNSLQLTEEEKIQSDKINALYKVNSALKDIFHNNLFSDIGKVAREYLIFRKVPEDLWREFGLGFASHTTLEYSKLLEMEFSNEILRESQNFLNSNNTRFFGRLIFPIENTKNNVVGFGGRILGIEKDTAKYINSPESLIFKKREIFYGENKINRSLNKLVITEGYLDVISMISHGFLNTVAPLGTAISEEHLKKAVRIADNPCIALDGDNAGIHAMYLVIDKILPLLKDDGKSFNFLKLPDGNDLDNMVNENAEELRGLFQHQIILVDMLAEKLLSEITVNSPENKLRMVNAIKREVELIRPKLLQRFYCEYLNNKILVNSNTNFKFKHENRALKIKKDSIEKVIDKKSQNEFLLGLIIATPRLLDFVFEQFLNLDCDDGIKSSIMKVYSGDSSINGEILLEKLKSLGYNDTVGKIFEKNIHLRFGKKYDIEQLREIWLNLYHKVNAGSVFCGKTNNLRKWKALSSFKKKIEQD